MGARVTNCRRLLTPALIAFLVCCLPVARSSAAAPPGAGLSIHGTQFLKDGHPWRAKGIDFIAFEAPRARRDRINQNANRHFTIEELVRIRQIFGIDTVRISISQPGLDPQSPIYDPGYADEILSGLQKARSLGFVVILSMQWENPSGLTGQPNMPGDSTVRAWKTMAAKLSYDPYVMLEIFNEPQDTNQNPDGADNWRRDFQRLVDTLRGLGQRNILLLDGLHRAADVGLQLPEVHDPLNRWAYAVHPYPFGGNMDEAGWDRYFGERAVRNPVIVSEWGSSSDTFNNWCGADTPDQDSRLLRYLNKHGLGLVIWAVDYPNSLVTDLDTLQPNNFDRFTHCGDRSNTGIGELFRRWRP